MMVEKAALTVRPSSGTVSMATSISSTVSLALVLLISRIKNVNMLVSSCPSCQDFALTLYLALISNPSIQAPLSIMGALSPLWPSVVLVN